MATITVSITAGGNTVGRTKTVSAQDLTRLVSAYRSLLGLPGLTDDQVVQGWADQLLSITKAAVRQRERDVAAQGTSDIALT